jgi:hypothetical protein
MDPIHPMRSIDGPYESDVESDDESDPIDQSFPRTNQTIIGSV